MTNYDKMLVYLSCLIFYSFLSIFWFLNLNYYIVLHISFISIVTVFSPTFFFYALAEVPFSFSLMLGYFCETTLFYSESVFFFSPFEKPNAFFDFFFGLLAACYLFYSYYQFLKNLWNWRLILLFFTIFWVGVYIFGCILLVFYTLGSVIDFGDFSTFFVYDFGFFDDYSDVFNSGSELSYMTFLLLLCCCFFFFLWRNSRSFLLFIAISIFLTLLLEDMFLVVIGFIVFREVLVFSNFLRFEYAI